MRQRLEGERQQRQFDVLPECWHAVMVFCAMSTQWRWASGAEGPALRRGLVYASLPVVMASLRRTPHRRPLDELMPQLQVMEDAALAALDRER